VKKTGNVRKMRVELSDPVQYFLPIGDSELNFNPYLGQQIAIRHKGAIHCIACGRETSKSFNQGYCFPCLRTLARCDTCIVRPELCHYYEETCREPNWARENCLQQHVVYLANSSGLKIGITRQSQVPDRWIDQGATSALPILIARERLVAGLIEMIIKQHVSDRTDWRKMLKGDPVQISLPELRDSLLLQCENELFSLKKDKGESAFQEIQADIVNINYPVDQYPEKVKAHNLDKTPTITGKLHGIKGQYLILDSGVLNIRKYAGYELTVEVM